MSDILKSWRETFEACAVAGLKLPDDCSFTIWYDKSTGVQDKNGGNCLPLGSLYICRVTAFQWLDYPVICPKANGFAVVMENSDEWCGPTLDAAIQAACRAKAGLCDER